MANKQVVFADRMVGFSVQNGLVRLDLGVIAGPAKGKDDKPAVKLDVTHQLVMPLDAFLQAVNMQSKVAKEIVTRAGKGKAAKSAATETPAVN